MTAMNIPRWAWWMFGSVITIMSTPYILVAFFMVLQWLNERPLAFEEKVQLKGAAVWTSGTTESPSADGDACSIKYTLQFARTGEDREAVDEIENSFAESCFTPETLSRAAWFGFGNGIYLRVGNELYWRGFQGRWHKHPSFDGENDWSLNHVKAKEGQIIYERTKKGRKFYRVFQLPQQVGAPWILKDRS
jgi:hypothetical protein